MLNHFLEISLWQLIIDKTYFEFMISSLAIGIICFLNYFFYQNNNGMRDFDENV